MRDYTSERSYDLNIIIALPFQRPVESEPDSEGGAAEDAALIRLLGTGTFGGGGRTSGGGGGKTGGGLPLFNGDALDVDAVAAAAKADHDRRRFPVAVRPNAHLHDRTLPESLRRRRCPATGAGPRDAEDAGRSAVSNVADPETNAHRMTFCYMRRMVGEGEIVSLADPDTNAHRVTF